MVYSLVGIEIILSLYNLTVKQLRKGSESSAIYWMKEIVIIARMVPIVKALLVFSINLISPRLPVSENTLCCVSTNSMCKSTQQASRCPVGEPLIF